MEYLQTTASTGYPPEELFRKFLNFFFKTSKKTPLKKSCVNNDGDSRPVNVLKTQSRRVKTMIFVAYMLKIISLIGTPHSHEFGEDFYLANPAQCFLFVSKIVLLFWF